MKVSPVLILITGPWPIEPLPLKLGFDCGDLIVVVAICSRLPSHRQARHLSPGNRRPKVNRPVFRQRDKYGLAMPLSARIPAMVEHPIRFAILRLISSDVDYVAAETPTMGLSG